MHQQQEEQSRLSYGWGLLKEYGKQKYAQTMMKGHTLFRVCDHVLYGEWEALIRVLEEEVLSLSQYNDVKLQCLIELRQMEKEFEETGGHPSLVQKLWYWMEKIRHFASHSPTSDSSHTSSTVL